MHVCFCVCLCTSACEEVATEAWTVFLKSLQQCPHSFSDPDPAGHDLQDSGTRVSRCPARGPSRATVADDIRVEGSGHPCLLPSVSGPGEIELWPWEGGDTGEAGPVENPSPNEGEPEGQRPSVSSHPASAMSVHRGQASGRPEKGMLSKNVGHHLWGLQRPRDTPGV